MGHETSKVTGLAVDNESGTLTDISGNVNDVSWDGGQELLEDTGLGDTRRTVIAGLANASNVQVNGMLDSTTRAIFGPIVDGTSITKTVEFKLATGDFYSGEAWPESVNLSTNVGQINTWSVNFRAQDGLSSTSVTGVA